jgi:hypothetical protein
MNASQDLMWDRYQGNVIRASAERLWQPGANIRSLGNLKSQAIGAYLRKFEQL